MKIRKDGGRNEGLRKIFENLRCVKLSDPEI